MQVRVFARIHLPSDLEIPVKSGDIYAGVYYARDFVASTGYFSVDYGSTHRVLDLNQTGALRECGVFETGIWTLTTSNDLRFHYEYVGREVEGQINVMAAKFPPNTLPLDIWREFRLLPSIC